MIPGDLEIYPFWPDLHDDVAPTAHYGEDVRATGYLYEAGKWVDELADVGPQLLKALGVLLGVHFTVVAMQGYLDETASTQWHSDPSVRLQAVLSIGATRRLGFRRIDDVNVPWYLTMDDGDLAYMPAGFQHEWEHSVPVEDTPRAERLSLVFRA